MTSMLSSPTLGVPTLTIEHTVSAAELKVRVGRGRSSSVVKVETVGEDSQEEGLDQSLYGNMNAEWVNRKGMCIRRLYELCALNLWLPQGLGSSTQYSSLRVK